MEDKAGTGGNSTHLDPQQITSQDVKDDDETVEANLKEIMVLVEPILDGIFEAAVGNQDYWLKKKSAAILSDWIVSVLNVSQLLERQVQALGATLQAQEKELEQLRPVKSKMWTPGL